MADSRFCFCRTLLQSTTPPFLRPLDFFTFSSLSSHGTAVRSLWRVFFIFLAPSFFIVYPIGTTEAARHFASVDTRLSSLGDRMSLIHQAFEHYTSSVTRAINLEKKLKRMQGMSPPPSPGPRPSSSTTEIPFPPSRSSYPAPPSIAAAVSSSFRRDQQHPHSSPTTASPSLALHRRVALGSSPPSSPSLAARRGASIGTLLLPRTSPAPTGPLLSRPEMITGIGAPNTASKGRGGGGARENEALRSYRASSDTSLLQGSDGLNSQHGREVLKTRMLLIRENFEQSAARAKIRNLINDQWQDLLTSTDEGFPSLSTSPLRPQASPFRKKSFQEDGGKESKERQLLRMADKLNQINYYLELDQATRLNSDS